MYSTKIEPKYNSGTKPKVGLIALATDFIIEKDFIESYKWFTLAAKNGNEEAKIQRDNSIALQLSADQIREAQERVNKFLKKYATNKFLIFGFTFNASNTFVAAFGIIGSNNIEIFAICSRAICKILFIFSTLFFLSFHGSSSLMYLLVKKLIFIKKKLSTLLVLVALVCQALLN